MSDSIVTNYGSGIQAGDWITTTSGTYTISNTTDTTLTIEDPYQKQIDKLEEKFDKIMERLAILDDPDPEQLAKNKSLKRAYEKYKMLETLAGAKK